MDGKGAGYELYRGSVRGLDALHTAYAQLLAGLRRTLIRGRSPQTSRRDLVSTRAFGGKRRCPNDGRVWNENEDRVGTGRHVGRFRRCSSDRILASQSRNVSQY